MKFFIQCLATGFGAGLLPLVPGTWGSVVGVGLFCLVAGLPPPVYAATLVAFIALAVWVSSAAQTIYNDKDPSKVVIDEIVGMLVTLAFHPVTWPVLVAGFVLFRIFDITKPWPVCFFEERFPDGRGIVFDDVMAGVYANAVLSAGLWGLAHWNIIP